MKGKKLSVYTAALMITLFGGAATLLIVDVANSPLTEIGYANLDPETMPIKE